MDLLRLLAARPDQVVSRERIMAALWPDVIVADDALARTLFKLRRALGDDAKSSRYIETLPKRGYRLIAAVRNDSADVAADDGTQANQTGAIVLADGETRQTRRLGRIIAASSLVVLLATTGLLMWTQTRNVSPADADPDRALIERADDFYYQYSRADNEAAIELYERILISEPDRTEALRGLANALTQRMIRWPQDPRNGALEFKTLSASLENGHLKAASAQRSLERAELLARRAIAIKPDDSLSHRALGLVLSTQSNFDQAIAEYRTAIALDPDAWGAMINLSEALQLTGKEDGSLAALVDAHAAMTRRYSRDKQHIMPYYADLAVLIGDRLARTNRGAEAEAWFRRALVHAPLHPAATVALADRLLASGRRAEAESLCNELNTRVSVQPACTALLSKGNDLRPGEPEGDQDH
jgi:transcriptional activator of cad operon